MFHRLISILLVALSSSATLASDHTLQEASPSARKSLEGLLAEYNAGVEDIRKEMLKAMAPERVAQKLWVEGPLQRLAHFAPRFLDLARQNPRTDVAWEALRWIVYVRGFSEQDKAVALEQMLRDHMGDQQFYKDLYFHLHRPGVDPEKFYRRVLEHPDAPRRVAGLARFSLAESLKQQGGDKAEAEAVRLFQEVRKGFADLPHPFDQQRGTLGNAAELAQFEIEHLQLGRLAPDIIGADVDGKRFGLSDYHGKVVMLVFCGDWCVPCRSLYPHEEKIAEKYREQPFAIVGVNSDSPKTLRSVIEREKFRFRWFSDGSTSGPISARWNVQTWPTIYVLDAEGKIRMKKVGAAEPEQIDLMIEQLLAEAEIAKEESSN